MVQYFIHGHFVGDKFVADYLLALVLSIKEIAINLVFSIRAE